MFYNPSLRGHAFEYVIIKINSIEMQIAFFQQKNAPFAKCYHDKNKILLVAI